MLEARLEQAVLLKKLLDCMFIILQIHILLILNLAIKELVTDANFECAEDGIKLQAMDNSHVALVAVELGANGFKKYRCDRPMPLGVNLNSLSKVLKCAKDDDQVTLKAGDNNDVLNLLYESPTTDRVAEYEMKLMDIDVDALGIPDTDYDASVHMSSAEFARIVRDLSNLGESVKIEVTKEGVRFSSEGDAANGNVLMKHSDEAARKYNDKEEGSGGESSKKGKGKEKKEEDVKEEEEDTEMADASQKISATQKTDDDDDDDEILEVKQENVKREKKKEKGEDEEEEEEEKAASEQEEEEEKESEKESDDDDDTSSKKRKRKANGDSKKSKKAKKVTPSSHSSYLN